MFGADCFNLLVRCARDVLGRLDATDASRTARHASTVTARESESRSEMLWTTDIHQLTSCRGFTESSVRIQGLLDEKTMLIAALNEVSQSPDFDQSRHPDVLKLLETVSVTSPSQGAY